MIPEIAVNFNFDIVVILLLISYIGYGYVSGGHKQIRLSINLILPFLLIYYLGPFITEYIYIPLSNTFLFEIIDTVFGFAKYTIGMVIAYIAMYIMLFTGIFLLSIYAKKYVLNENMRAKLGKKNNYLGAIFALLNGYVLIYFLILPAFSLNIVGPEAKITMLILDNPPPFSRIARTAEKAVPIKNLADKADAFQKLIQSDAIESYYTEAIYEYQQTYMGETNSYEAQFMDTVYPYLSPESTILLNSTYNTYFNETLSESHYLGVSRVLVHRIDEDNLLYEQLLEEEALYEEEYNSNKEIIREFEDEFALYEQQLAIYEYQIAYNEYQGELDTYITALESYVTAKVEAAINEDNFSDTFSLKRPTLDVVKPNNYVELDPLVEPVSVTESQTVLEAMEFVGNYNNQISVTNELNELGLNFENHQGLLKWYVDELDREMVSTVEDGDISNIIVSYKTNYDTMIEEIDDDNLKATMYTAQMSIETYDVFQVWLDCTIANKTVASLELLSSPEFRCDNLQPESNTQYDFTEEAIDTLTTLFEGDTVSWIITQYKYDYEAGVFNDLLGEYDEIQSVLGSTKELADEYELYYRDIATSIEGNISMVFKIGISVMKYRMDVYDMLENTPLLSAMFNDASRICNNATTSPLDRTIEVCPKTTSDSGLIREFFNMRYLTSEIVFKAYIMVDENNEPIIYDITEIEDLLNKANNAVTNNVIEPSVMRMLADQFAFNVIDETSNTTLLDQMYQDEQITIEAMRILADDEYDLFSDEFSARVRSLIR